jgi:hypothetical protein
MVKNLSERLKVTEDRLERFEQGKDMSSFSKSLLSEGNPLLNVFLIHYRAQKVLMVQYDTIIILLPLLTIADIVVQALKTESE